MHMETGYKSLAEIFKTTEVLPKAGEKTSKHLHEISDKLNLLNK